MKVMSEQSNLIIKYSKALADAGKEIRDLRAELEAAETRLLSECLDNNGLTNAEVIKVLRQANTSFKQERDNLQAANADKDKIIASLTKARDKHKEISNTLQAANAHLEYQLGETCLKIAEYEHTPLEDVKAWCDGLRKGYIDLQTANAVLVDTIKQSVKRYYYRDAGGVIVDKNVDAFELDTIKILKQALSTTPTQASERVNEIVEALEESKLQIEYMQEKFSVTSTGNAVLERIKRALAKYHGKEVEKDD